MKKILSGFALMGLLAACSTTQYSSRGVSIDDGAVIASDVVVDLKVDLTKKIESVSTMRKSEELAKNEAYYLAIRNNNVDVVVDPIFEIITTDKFLFFGGKSKAKLMGYGAHYTNPRSKVDAIRELKSVDTLDVIKFRYIYMGQFMSTFEQAARKPKTPVAEVPSTKIKKPNVGTDSKSNFAVKAGISTNNIEYDWTGSMENNGMYVGIAYDADANGKLGFGTELVYSFNNQVDHLHLPILAKYSITKSIKVHLGPSATFFSSDDSLKTFGFGVDAGVSVNLGKRFFIDARYSKGLTNISDDGYEEEVKYDSTTFGIGYRF